MTPGGRDSTGGTRGEGVAPDEVGRPAFRQEADRLVLSNGALSLAFCIVRGTLISLYLPRTQVELLDSAEAMAEGHLWQMVVAAGDSATAALSSRDCAEFSHAVFSETGEELRLELRWRGLRSGATKIEGQVTVKVAVASGSSTAWLQIEAALPSHVWAESFSFPCLWALHPGTAPDDEALFLPISGGVLIASPRAALSVGAEDTGWRIVYPGPASMQMFGFSLGNRATAWLAAGDGRGGRKTLRAVPTPRSGRIALWIEQRAVGNSAGSSPGYPSAVGAVPGDWFDAAREYRVWATQQPWCAGGRGGERSLPALASSYGLWLSHWGDGRGAMAAARELQRLANLPVKVDWRCWQRCACGGAYPDYFPPRDGEEAFAEAKRHLAGAGVLSQLAFDGLLASPESEAWQAEGAARYRVRSRLEEGEPRGPVRMCPYTRYWRQKLISLARGAVGRGFEGVYFERLGNAEPVECADDDHGHGWPSDDSWTTGVRRALGELKDAVGPSISIATDGPTESYLDLVDSFHSTHAAGEREALLHHGFGGRWSPIPLFAAVYHDHATTVGPAVSLVNQRPHDPLSTDRVADLRLPASVMAGDYESQFCLEVGRGAVWGNQLMLTNFARAQTRNDSNRRKLAFLSAVLRAQAWGVGALLPYSAFMGLLAIECSPIEVDLLVNPAGSRPSDRRAVRRSMSSVIGSAWRTPGAGLALLLANVHSRPVEFAAQLRTGRLGFGVPLAFVGRTFAEDGDVPAATLRSAGNEIGGRVPGRSIVLLALR